MNERQTAVMDALKRGDKVRDLYEGSFRGSNEYFVTYSSEFHLPILNQSEVDELFSLGLIEHKWPDRQDLNYYTLSRK